MRKLFIFTTIFYSLFLTSCSVEDKNDYPSNDNYSLIVNSTQSYFENFDFEIIGIEHNNGLNSIFNKLSQVDVMALNQEELNSIIFEETNLFLLGNENIEGFDESILDLIQPDSNSTSNLTAILKNEVRENISSEFLIEEINNFDVVLNDYKAIENYSYIQAIEELRLIESTIKNSELEFDEKEYVAVLSLISTGIHSLTYWNDNIDNWTDLNPNIETMDWGWFKETIGDMAVADAYGAATGAVVGFVASVVSGPGVVVGTAAGAVGYGMNASAIRGVYNLFN